MSAKRIVGTSPSVFVVAQLVFMQQSRFSSIVRLFSSLYKQRDKYMIDQCFSVKVCRRQRALFGLCLLEKFKPPHSGGNNSSTF